MCSLAPNKRNANDGTLRYHFSHIRLAKIQKLQKVLRKWAGPGPLGMEAQVVELAGHCVCRAVGLPRLPLLSSGAEITGCSGNRVDWAEERKNTCLGNGSDTGCPFPHKHKRSITARSNAKRP